MTPFRRRARPATDLLQGTVESWEGSSTCSDAISLRVDAQHPGRAREPSPGTQGTHVLVAAAMRT